MAARDLEAPAPEGVAERRPARPRTGREGVALLDGAGRVAFADGDIAKLFGVDVPKLLGQDIFRFVDERERPAARQALRRAVRTGKVGRHRLVAAR